MFTWPEQVRGLHLQVNHRESACTNPYITEFYRFTASGEIQINTPKERYKENEEGERGELKVCWCEARTCCGHLSTT